MQFSGVSKPNSSAPTMRPVNPIEKVQYQKPWSPQFGRPSPIVIESGQCCQINDISQAILQHLSKKYSHLDINPSIPVIQFLKEGQPLHFAVQKYDMQLFDLLLATEQFDVNLLDKNNRSALLVACELSNTIAVKKLISAGSNLVEKDVDGSYPLECICKDQIFNPMEILDLLDKLPPEDISKTGSLLHYTKDLATIKFLVEHGVSIDTVDSEGRTVLWKAIENYGITPFTIKKNRILSLIGDLIKLGASCEKVLPLLAMTRDEELLTSLKGFGFEVNSQNQNGDNLILLTCRSFDRKSRVGISCWLLDLIRLGCDPTQLNKCNECALTLITEFQFIADSFILDLLSDLSEDQLHQAKSVIFFTKSKEILTVLFKRGNVPVDYYSEMGDTVLYLAVNRLDVELIKFLLSKGADPDFATVKRGYLEGPSLYHQTPYQLLFEKKMQLIQTLNCYNSKNESDLEESVVTDLKAEEFIEVKLSNLKIEFDESEDDIILYGDETAEESNKSPMNSFKSKDDKDEDEIILFDRKTVKFIFSKDLERTPNIMITPEGGDPKVTLRRSKTLPINRSLSLSPPKNISHKFISSNSYKINERRPRIVPIPLSSQKDFHLSKVDVFNEIQALFDDYRNRDLTKTLPEIDSQEASSDNDNDDVYNFEQTGSTVSLSSDDSNDDTEDEKFL